MSDISVGGPSGTDLPKRVLLPCTTMDRQEVSGLKLPKKI